MELVITEKADDNSVKFRCDLCDYNPYQAWCKGNTARFHAALMKHKQTTRHREAEAFARGEQPVSISKGGVISANAPTSATQPFYISKLENMIDKLEQRIDALNSAFEETDTSSEYNLNYLGSLVDDFRQNGFVQKSQKNGDLVISPSVDIESRQSPVSIRDVLYTYHFKEVEVLALRNYGDRSSITNTNALGAICRVLSWVEVYERDEGRKDKSLAFLKKTRMMMEKLEAMKKEGWRIDDDDFNAIGERLDDILEYDFTVYK
jgi:tetrahydromethanopterin S-methyltransferase subunit G